ncbi:DUF4199 domain-containing protein [Aureibacter tunicatorum]|uniref:DUF4199 domain-containing protein n=1 Tax=Aureibacter tunicatorum TaxID=866807 RepID=A0AAE3XNS9_9BACT|nr:DUF4199 domain-containing protein [Aureibacter tunicatorum]MDR6241326.1 hypothetical protein [Aureibacter tunicatorum]BDD03585.1 hypothetical protein AUTU_10680 [Aureibacter tunicatorum]
MNNLLVKIGLKYGGIGGLMAVLAMVAFVFIDNNPLGPEFYFAAPLVFVFVFFAMREFKFFKDGYMTFSQGVAIGFITYVMIGIISGIAVFALLQWIEPELLPHYIELKMKGLMENKTEIIAQYGEGVFNDNYDKLPKTTAWELGLTDFIQKLLSGVIITMILTMLMRKSKPIEE